MRVLEKGSSCSDKVLLSIESSPRQFFVAIKCVFLGSLMKEPLKDTSFSQSHLSHCVSAVVHLDRKQKRLLCIIDLYLVRTDHIHLKKYLHGNEVSAVLNTFEPRLNHQV